MPGTTTSTTSGVPAPEPPAASVRPRFFFSAQDLPELRRHAATGLRARVREHLLRVCDALIDPAHPAYLDYRERRQDDWRQRHGMFRIFPSLQQLAAGYALTGNRAYGQAARDAVMTIIEEGLADTHAIAYGSPYRGWRRGPGHDKGKLAWAFAWVFDMCYELFSPEQRRRFAAFADESITFYRQDVASWEFDRAQVTNNRGVRGICSMTVWALACEGEAGFTHDVETLVRTGVVAMAKYLHLAFDAEGAPYEGAGYGSVLGFIGQLGQVIGRRGGPNCLASHRFERILEYFLYELVPGGGTVNNLNDCDPPAGSVACSLPLMGTPRGRLIPWLAAQLDLHPQHVATWLDASGEKLTGEHIDLPWLLWWRDQQPVQTPQQLGYPLAHRFLTRGVASHRTGWEADDWLLTHFCGREEILCHRQGDHNHLTFWAGDELFLADPGYGALAKGYQRKMTDAIDRYYKHSDVHNVVLFNGEDQVGTSASGGWAEGALLDFEQQEAFSASLGDAAACAGPDHTVRRSLRRVVLVRQAPRRFLAVIDLNELDGQPFDLDVQWQSKPDHRIELVEGGFIIHGRRHRCRAWTFSPQHITATTRATYSIPQLRLRMRAPVVETVTVFCPLRAGEAEPAVAIARTGEGAYAITCEGVTLHASAAVTDPLRKPVATRVVV